MHPGSSSTPHPRPAAKEAHEGPAWRQQFRRRARTLAALTQELGAAPCDPDTFDRIAARYPVAVTPYYLSLIDPQDPADPIARQCLPDPEELRDRPDEGEDPLDERGAMPVPDLIHRYPDRCLAMVSRVCATHCRHCNRKRRWRGADLPEAAARPALEAMLAYIKGRPPLREVILSGGDPLLLDEAVLEWFLGSLRHIPHLEVLRIGSRVPVVLPMRITPELARLLAAHRPLWFLTQFNHPRELTPAAAGACDALLTAGIPVLNQSVLLKGVNDRFETLRDLFCGLTKIGVKPYYLFQCEPVRGAAHFRVPIARGRGFMRRLWNNVSGLCQPRYVYDLPGGRGKTSLEAPGEVPWEPDADAS